MTAKYTKIHTDPINTFFHGPASIAQLIESHKPPKHKLCDSLEIGSGVSYNSPQEQAQAQRPSAESSLVAIAPSCVFTINGNPTDAQDM
jgi:hypothetical protein